MSTADAHKHWEVAAPGWARWEQTIAKWMEPATDTMLHMAGVKPGVRVLDLACGAGSQTLRAAQAVGADGHVLASDIADAMLHYVRENARAAGLDNISTLAGAAEELDVAPKTFDAAICRLGLMLFSNPAHAIVAVRRALRPRGKLAVVVFTTPAANPFMAKPMQILLRHAGKAPPALGQPGIFSLGAASVLERLFTENGFASVEERHMALTLRMSSSAEALAMVQEGFGAYRAVVSDCSESVRTAAWAEVTEALKGFETDTGFVAPAEVLVAAGTNPS